MMNSCEFEQPLDLRLKALNLSIGSCQQQHCLASKNNINSTTTTATTTTTINNNNNNSSSSLGVAEANSVNSSTSTSTNSLISHQSYSSSVDQHQYQQVPLASSHTTFGGSLAHISTSPLNPPAQAIQHAAFAYQAHSGAQRFHPPPAPTTHYHHQMSPPTISAYHHSASALAPTSLAQQSSFKQQQQHPTPATYQHQGSLQSPLQMAPAAGSPIVTNQQRSTNNTLHCQPLNHLQPHPLASRFHSQPASLTANHQPALPFATDPTTMRFTEQSSNSVSLKAPSISQPGSPQHQSPTAATSQQQVAFPVKSLSISSHHHLLGCSTASSNFANGPTSGGSSSANHLGRSSSSSDSSSQLSSMDSSIQQTVLRAASRVATSSHLSNAHCNPGRVSHMSQQHQHHPQHSHNHVQRDLSVHQYQPVVTADSAPPITRQHSLVSRYNCKPCGIVFSQPETLRAHQEGYCTKRDRTQSQTRSQSAVSPTGVVTSQHTSASSATSPQPSN